ncbi:MAG: hypothetical protein KC419_10265 [Anaerolineales bacterium]|nr:hypothetical protein [Anaerolineales bacterium]MCA9928853.1 hypothetical protein [Anaerolineales bacterium]
MAKRKVELTELQKKKNEEILSRLAEERRRLIEETRNLQKQSRRRGKQETTPQEAADI